MRGREREHARKIVRERERVMIGLKDFHFGHVVD